MSAAAQTNQRNQTKKSSVRSRIKGRKYSKIGVSSVFLSSNLPLLMVILSQYPVV